MLPAPYSLRDSPAANTQIGLSRNVTVGFTPTAHIIRGAQGRAALGLLDLKFNHVVIVNGGCVQVALFIEGDAEESAR